MSNSGVAQIRLEDYLNDKFQTATDLANVDNQLTQIKEQQALLRQQLVDAQTDLELAEQTFSVHATALRDQATAFERQQNDIDQWLKIITQSDISDDAVNKFERSMARLNRVQVASGYIDLLKMTNDLVQSAEAHLLSDTTKAVSTYSALHSLTRAFKEAQPTAEGAAPHLADHLDSVCRSLYMNLESKLESRFEKALQQMKWPSKDLNLLGSVTVEWSSVASHLLQLQEPDLLVDANRNSSGEAAPSLLPLNIMARPLMASFRYHFYGDRPTNRLDKPEYFFSRILDLLDWHGAFMSDYLQPILDSRISASDALENVYTDALSSFITALLPVVTEKCLSLLPRLRSQPQLLSHLVHEMMAFDNTLRDVWSYAPSSGPFAEWKGLTWEMLSTHQFFDTWLTVEKDFALTRYKKIRDSEDSKDIDYDGFENGQTKPTKGAVRLNDLLETITDRYRMLSSFSQKMKFLMDIQLSIFDDYHGFLHEALEAYLASSHTAGRLISGQTVDEALGMKGLESLAKIFGSAEYLERKMADWSDDVFFLELWEELQDRASRNSGTSATIGKDLRIDEVAAKTSSTIRHNASLEPAQGGALFDETALSYRRLRERSETGIISALERNVRNALKPFIALPSWTSLVSADPAQMAPSSALDGFLQSLSALLGFLSNTLGRSVLRRITRQVCSVIQQEIFNNVVLRKEFSTSGALQLKRDIRAIEETVDTTVNMRGETARYLRRLNQALVLLSLPIRASGVVSGTSLNDFDEWGFDAENQSIDGPSEASESSKVWGLWEAEKAIFASNDSARDALADMQISEISANEARNVIKRRIELNS